MGKHTNEQPADGVEALAPAAAVAYACLRESGYHEAAANLREYLRTLAASKAEPLLSGSGEAVSNGDSKAEYHGGSGASYPTLEAAQRAGESSVIGPLTFTGRTDVGVRVSASKADSAQGDWVPVPRVPTDDMLRAAYPLHWFDGPGQRLKQDYQTMLAAAPTPQPEGGRGAFYVCPTCKGIGNVTQAGYDHASRLATPTDAARVRDAWLPIESAPQDGTLGPIGESPNTIADEMEAWSEKKMTANGSSRIDRTLVREWAKRLRGEA